MYEYKDWETPVMLMVLIACSLLCFGLLLFILMKIKWIKGKFNFPLYKKDIFQANSVYRFFLSTNKKSNALALVAYIIQILILFYFLQAANYTDESNAYEYPYSSSADAVNGNYQKFPSVAWPLFWIVLLLFLSLDLWQGLCMVYRGVKCNEIRSFFAGFMLLFITFLSLATSFIYNRAIATNITEVLKDFAVILFLNVLDEALFATMNVICPTWIENLDINVERLDYDLAGRVILIQDNYAQFEERTTQQIQLMSQHQQDQSEQLENRLNELETRLNSKFESEIDDLNRANEELDKSNKNLEKLCENLQKLCENLQQSSVEDKKYLMKRENQLNTLLELKNNNVTEANISQRQE